MDTVEMVSFPPLTHDVRAHVCVIGAGIAGTGIAGIGVIGDGTAITGDGIAGEAITGWLSQSLHNSAT